jgi:hypothetical protein
MANTDRRQVLIITVPSGKRNVYNTDMWKKWGEAFPTHVVGEDQAWSKDWLNSLNQQYDCAWIADSEYCPLRTAFPRVLLRSVNTDCTYSLFKVGKPEFSRNFYTAKYTHDADVHDLFGGLRYVDLQCMSELPDDYVLDVESHGVRIDFQHTIASRLQFPYSVFHLSSNEPMSVTEESLRVLSKFYPSIEAVNFGTGILESHRRIAELSDSDMFVVFDADCSVRDELLSERVPIGQEDATHVWYVENPINGLIYGHGGPKMFSKHAFADLKTSATVDVTTSASAKKLVLHTNCVGIHKFNWSAEATWRTAFRETAKLTWILGYDPDAEERLKTWVEVADMTQPFWEYCLAGALQGHLWATTVNSQGEGQKINDFSWLSEKFAQVSAEDLDMSKYSYRSPVGEDEDDEFPDH